MTFHEDLLFTHRGLSGLAVLQISSYWKDGTPLHINLLPGTDMAALLQAAKTRSRKLVANELAALPADPLWPMPGSASKPELQRPINEASDKALTKLAEQLQRWEITPTGSEGYKKAEVTLGGIDTKALSQQTMECKTQPGLYFDWRGGGHHRLAGRLQLSVGLGQRLCLRAGHGPAARSRLPHNATIGVGECTNFRHALKTRYNARLCWHIPVGHTS